MSKMRLFGLLLLLWTPVWGQAPALLSHQGVLTDGSGAVVADNTYSLQFDLYAAATAGSSLWSETHAAATVNGAFAVVLGSSTPLSLSVDQPLWLGIRVNGGAELAPRLQLTGSPYSMVTLSVSSGAVGSAGLADGAVTSLKIADATVSSADLASGAVTSLKIVDATISSADLASGSVTSLKIVDATVSSADLAPGAVGASQLVAGQTVRSLNSLADHVTLAAGANITLTPAGNTLTIAASSGAPADNSVTSVKIVDGAIATADLAANAVTSAKIADATVSSADLASGVIGASQLVAGQTVRSLNTLADHVTLAAGTNVTITPAGNTLTFAASGGTPSDNTVTSAKIVDGAIATDDLAGNAVTSVKIADATVSSADLASGVVTSLKIVDGAITSAKIADATVSSADLASGVVGASQLVAGQTVRSLNTLADHVTLAAGTNLTLGTAGNTLTFNAPSLWALSGNSGTTAGTNFVGTTDNIALEFKVNSARALRLEPNATSPGVIGGFSGNAITSGVVGGTIGGGGASGNTNLVTDDYSTVGGGQNNQAGDSGGTTADRTHATVGGGSSNSASGIVSTIAGGSNNSASAQQATVGGGASNQATGVGATIAGGVNNQASADYATVAGGVGGTASSYGATVAGGVDNLASGSYSFAAGRRAQAIHGGAFVWGDQTDADFSSTGGNQFLIRASGGVGIGTDSPGAELEVNGEIKSKRYQFLANDKAGTQAISGAATHTITFVERSDLDNAFTDGTDKFTAPVAGFYFFSATATFSDGNENGSDVTFGILRNGSTADNFSSVVVIQPGGIFDPTPVTLNAMMQLSAGDEVDVRTVVTAADFSVSDKSFMGFLLTP